MTESVDARNRETSEREVAEFKSDPPDKLFAYSLGAGTITTWMGDLLGTIIEARIPFRSNFGDRRQYIRVNGINGKKYWGWYYFDAGSYCRLYLYR